MTVRSMKDSPARYLIENGLADGLIPSELRRPCRIVTIFPDRGDRYLDLMYDDGWLAERQRGSLDAGRTAP
jgi:cysteine synthase